MIADDLQYESLTANHLKSYRDRAPTDSAQFIKWFLENLFRLDPQDADDAAVDAKQDKGIDAIYVNDITETIHIIQSKVRQKTGSTLGDTDLKSFIGAIQQFKTAEGVQAILDSDANDRLKNAIRRNKILEKINSGYTIDPVFITNISANSDAYDYIAACEDHVTLYDAARISADYIELDGQEGVKGDFTFDVSDTDVIKYNTSDTIRARLFLADALQLTHLAGIQDGKLFERNVRLSLGDTKINKSLVANIGNKSEHKNFPLYHNGITILCDEFVDDTDEKLTLRNYVVVNGAQSLSSLHATKNKITSDLRILVKAVEVKGDTQLADKITTNSNNQNAIKARDMRSNHGIQQRLKAEIDSLLNSAFVYEVKRGEKSNGKVVLNNEEVGLILLSMDLGEPWSCHQKYKIMDESHSKIFGRPDVSGWKVIGLHSLFMACCPALANFDDRSFGSYTLTRYFLAHAVSEIIKDSPVGKKAFSSLDAIASDLKKLEALQEVFAQIALTTADDLNAEIVDEAERNPSFDYKTELKSPNWCRSTVGKLKAQYKKDVTRKRAQPVDELLAPLGL